MRLAFVATLSLCLGASDGVIAAPQAPKHPTTKKAAPSVVAVPNDEPSAPSVEGMMTPKAVKLRPMTAGESDANAVWSTRAALNIAALQCQFSPYLATVRNYNDFLRQHAEELDHARMTMIEHFKRYDGSQAQNSFDRYTTQTYNSYSTLDAQYAFCIAAGSAGRTTLTIRKGDLAKRAGALRDQIRAALIPISAHALLQPVELTPEVLATL